MFKIFQFFLGFTILVILVLIAIPLFIDANDYKPEISKAVFDATGRNIEIEHIDLSAFPWVGVTLNNVKLQNTQGFKQPHILTVKAIDVQLEFLPLINKKIEVKRFNLDTPEIWLERRADGTNNWSEPQQAQTLEATQPTDSTEQPPVTIQQKPKPAPVKKDTLNPPIALNADLLQLEHGQISWSDESTGEVKLSDIQLEVHDLQFKQPITVDLSAMLGNDSFNIHANIGPLGNINALDLSKLPALVKIQSKGLSLAPLSPWLPKLDQDTIDTIGNLENAKVSLDVSLEQHADKNILSSGSFKVLMKDTVTGYWKADSKNLRSINIRELKLGINDTHILALSGKIKDLKRRPRFEFRMETAKLQRLWLNQFVPSLQELYQNHPNPWKSIKLGTLIAGDKDILEIRDLQLQLNGEPVQVSGNLALGNAPDAQLRITANDLHLDPWIPVSKTPSASANSETASASGAAVQETEPNLTFLKPWYLSLQFNAKSIYAMKLKLDNIRMTLSAEKGVVRLNPLSFEIDEGQVSENFTLYANQYPATWKESMKMSRISVQPILQAVADFDKLSGIAQLNTNLSGKGLLPKNIKRSLSGRGHFVFEDGRFKGVDIAKAVRKLKKSDSGTTQSTDFAQMQGNFRINKGVLVNNDLYMASPLFRLTGKGKLYLDPLKLDYHVRPRLIESLAGQGGSRTEQGVVIPLHISGPIDNLDISLELDSKSLLESAATINKATGNKVGGVGGKVLNQGFVKTRDEEAKKAAEKLKKQAADKLKDALKNFKF